VRGCLGTRLEEAVAWAQRAEHRIGVQPVTYSRERLD
jgi:hypothetical protein